MSDTPAQLPDGMPLGAALRSAREEAGWSLTDLARRSRVQVKYLAAFEAGDYAALPDPVYQRGFLAAAAAALGSDAAPLVARHGEELALRPEGRPRPPAAPIAPPRSAFLVAPRLLSMIGTALAVALVLAALGFEVWRIVTPPRLVLRSPDDGAISTKSAIQVAGGTEREAELRLNGERVYPAADGSFAETVNLHPGLNVIKISAKKPHSDERVLWRRIVWNPDGSETGRQ